SFRRGYLPRTAEASDRDAISSRAPHISPESRAAPRQNDGGRGRGQRDGRAGSGPYQYGGVRKECHAVSPMAMDTLRVTVLRMNDSSSRRSQESPKVQPETGTATPTNASTKR